jgi:hypothetical protein
LAFHGDTTKLVARLQLWRNSVSTARLERYAARQPRKHEADSRLTRSRSPRCSRSEDKFVDFFNALDLPRATTRVLKALCKDYGLEPGGNKKAILLQLRQHFTMRDRLSSFSPAREDVGKEQDSMSEQIDSMEPNKSTELPTPRRALRPASLEAKQIDECRLEILFSEERKSAPLAIASPLRETAPRGAELAAVEMPISKAAEKLVAHSVKAAEEDQLSVQPRCVDLSTGMVHALPIDGVASVGRNADCDILIDSKLVDSRHCVLVCCAGMVALEDVSSNDTFVNEMLVPKGVFLPQRVPLCRGDTIAFSDVDEGPKLLFLTGRAD